MTKTMKTIIDLSEKLQNAVKNSDILWAKTKEGEVFSFEVYKITIRRNSLYIYDENHCVLDFDELEGIYETKEEAEK